MVNSPTSFGSNGLTGFIWQRATALVVAAYILFLFGFFISHPHVDFETWQALYKNTGMRVFTLLALFGVAIHTWIGIWTVLTDYIKHTLTRLVLEILVIAALASYVLWTIQILWSV
jgi:succinate dehydrogenase / fumarate reductase, membrane anchor subunit